MSAQPSHAPSSTPSSTPAPPQPLSLVWTLLRADEKGASSSTSTSTSTSSSFSVPIPALREAFRSSAPLHDLADLCGTLHKRLGTVNANVASPAVDRVRSLVERLSDRRRPAPPPADERRALYTAVAACETVAEWREAVELAHNAYVAWNFRP
jgi:hypothetical protein